MIQVVSDAIPAEHFLVPRPMFRIALAVVLSCAMGVSLAAQQRPKAPRPAPASTPAPPSAPPADTGGAHTVLSGFVLDSMTNLPLAGATILISGTTLSAVSDAGGRFHFELDTLPPGTYVVGFFHPSLDSMGITPPSRPVTIARGTSTFLELAVPSARTIVAAVCPDSTRANGGGLIMGTVHDAVTDAPLANARVVAMWTGVNVGADAVLKVPRAASFVTGRDGVYRLCGIPAGTRVALQARVGKQQTGWVEMQITAGGMESRNFLVGIRDTTTVAARPATSAPAAGASAAPGAAATDTTPPPLGNSVLVGTVTAANGKPLENAEVLLLGSRLSTKTNIRGAFRFPGLPAGTQSVEIRQIGYSPRRYAVDLSPRHEGHLAAVLDERAQVLEAIEVNAKPRSSIPGFDERKKQGFGVFLSREDIEQKAAVSMTDLFRGLAGVTVASNGSGYVIQMTRTASVGYCPVQYYVDGSPLLASADDMDSLMRPDDIEAIEIYKSGTATPVQFQGSDGGSCGTIVIWTRRSIKQPKGTGNQ
jgi:hypothetical protein